MPVIKVWVADVSDNLRDVFAKRIRKAISQIPELNLWENDITVIFPSETFRRDLGEIIIEIIGLFNTPERTPEVRNLLAKKVGEAVEIPLTKVECFILPFDQSQGFYRSDM